MSSYQPLTPLKTNLLLITLPLLSCSLSASAGGSALEEHMFPNTPKEMVTLYHEKDGKLVLTQNWTLFDQGKAQQQHPLQFERVK